eukprot:EG_transcript_19198
MAINSTNCGERLAALKGKERLANTIRKHLEGCYLAMVSASGPVACVLWRSADLNFKHPLNFSLQLTPQTLLPQRNQWTDLFGPEPPAKLLGTHTIPKPLMAPLTMLPETNLRPKAVYQ